MDTMTKMQALVDAIKAERGVAGNSSTATAHYTNGYLMSLFATMIDDMSSKNRAAALKKIDWHIEHNRSKLKG
jgi:hypothetical protein